MGVEAEEIVGRTARRIRRATVVEGMVEDIVAVIVGVAVEMEGVEAEGEVVGIDEFAIGLSVRICREIRSYHRRLIPHCGKPCVS